MFQNKHIDWQNFSSGELKSSQGYLPDNNGFYNFSQEDTVREIPTSVLRDMPEYNKQIDLYAARYINENPKISILEVTKPEGEKSYFITHYDSKTQKSIITALKPNDEIEVRNSINTSRVTAPDLKTYSSHGDLVQNANASSVNEDKHLDFDGKLGSVQQDKEGNCLVLADIIATKNDIKQKEQLEKQITRDPFGNYIVYLPGAKSDKNNGEGDIFSDEVNKGAYVVIGKNELDSSFARYDGEVSLVALAVEKYYNQYGKKDYREIYNPETKLTEIREFNTTKRGLIPTVDDVASLLTGQQGTLMDLRSQEWRQLITENPHSLSVTANFDLPDDLPVQVGDDSVQVLTERHRYAVTSYDAQRRTYTIENPWNSEKKFEINAEYFDYYARDVINHT